MKKCPQCHKAFDDSWGICLYCSLTLLKISDDSEGSPKKPEQSWLAKSADMKSQDWMVFLRNQAIVFGIFCAIMYPIIWFLLELQAYHKGTFNNIVPIELTLYSPIFVICVLFKTASHLIGRWLYLREGSK